MADLTNFVVTSTDSDSGASVVVEDNGRVCYAYFMSPDGQLTGDVWLYNRCETPTAPEWSDRGKAPFANPSEFVRGSRYFELPRHESEIGFKWTRKKTGELFAYVLLRGMVIGKVGSGSKPGWSLAAAKDGPLALILPSEEN